MKFFTVWLCAFGIPDGLQCVLWFLPCTVHNVTYICYTIVPILGVNYENILYIYWGSTMWIYCTYIGGQVCEYIVHILGVKYVNILYLYWGVKYVNILYIYWGSSMWIYFTYIWGLRMWIYCTYIGGQILKCTKLNLKFKLFRTF